METFIDNICRMNYNTSQRITKKISKVFKNTESPPLIR